MSDIDQQHTNAVTLSAFQTLCFDLFPVALGAHLWYMCVSDKQTGTPGEISDFAHIPAYTQQLNQLQKRLYKLLDPNTVMEDYTPDQVVLIEKLGGRERILAISEFNHTPLPYS